MNLVYRDEKLCKKCNCEKSHGWKIEPLERISGCDLTGRWDKACWDKRCAIILLTIGFGLAAIILGLKGSKTTDTHSMELALAGTLGLVTVGKIPAIIRRFADFDCFSSSLCGRALVTQHSKTDCSDFFTGMFIMFVLFSTGNFLFLVLEATLDLPKSARTAFLIFSISEWAFEISTFLLEEIIEESVMGREVDPVPIS